MSLLAGLAVVTVPIMLHLFGQRQPQLIDFPALRFVRETTQEQSMSWQLRHFLLLLLRILMLAALALALSRPRVHSAVLGSILGVSGVGLCALLASLIAAVAYATRRPRSVWLISTILALALWLSAGLWGYRSLTTGPAVPIADRTAPIAAALIIDNGPSMEYRSGNQTRMESGKDIGLWVLDQLPIDSRVGILSGAPIGSLSLDPSTAKTQVKLMQTRGVHVDLPARVRTALDLVIENELERKEIYLITDLMSSSWTTVQSDLREILTEYQGEVLMQIIDVGAVDQANWQLGDPVPSAVAVPSGGDVSIEVTVQSPVRTDDPSSEANAQTTPAQSTVTVELLQEELDPKLPIIRNNALQTAPWKVVDRKVLDLSNERVQSTTLEARDLAEGTHHFKIRLDKVDPLKLDNERFISIVSSPQRPSLVIGDSPDLTRALRLIADPFAEESESSLAEQVRFNQLSTVEFDAYAVVCLLDPPPLSANAVEKLQQFVQLGGGLFMILGPNLGSVENLRGNAILDLLPGELDGVEARPQSDRSAFLQIVAPSHPAFHNLVDVEVGWQEYPIFRSWRFTKLAAPVQSLAMLSDNETHILLSQSVGRGQIVTLCTPVPQVDNRDRALWNELWIGDEPWATFFMLAGVIQTLSGANQQGMNFSSGAPLVLSNDTQVWPSRYELFFPDARPPRRLESADGLLNLGSFESAGIYRMRGVRGDPVARGFSINAPAADTQLQRLTNEQLNDALGPDNYHVARDRKEVQSSVGQARFGRELYPLMMVFVAGLFLAEQAMSNRFYKLNFGKT